MATRAAAPTFAPRAVALAAALLAASLAACAGARRAEPPPSPTPQPEPAAVVAPELPAPAPQEAPEPAAGESIVIGGERHPIGAPVVLWTDAGGYSAYGTEPFFPGEPRPDAPTGLRYKPGRKSAAGDLPEPSLAELQQAIDQFVLHFDVCGVSRQCFKVLHDIRGLSVHFLLDVDGTLYQTLDLADTAWHARQANARSIGVEIANIGAYAPGRPSLLDTWYARDDAGPRLALPERLGDGGVRTQPFVARPARPERVQGEIQGLPLEQFDYTKEQYDTLVKLAAALCRAFPRLEPDAPRDARGLVRTDVLSPEEFAEFHGILGHDHVTVEKVDPGPALDWEPFLERVRALLESP